MAPSKTSRRVASKLQSKTAPAKGKNTKKRKANEPAEESPTKLKKEESFNTKLRQAIEEVKTTITSKKTYKVDDYVSLVPKGTVFEDYSCMLNQTNIGQNNNKFYVIQVIQQNKKNAFYCFTRWGRVGESGQTKQDFFTDQQNAVDVFMKKFKDKTGNNWTTRDNFTPKPKKYTLLEMGDDDDDDDDIDGKTIDEIKVEKALKLCNVKSALDNRTQLMLKLIFNEEMFINQMTQMNLDVRKMPLGKLSKQQIAKGLETLIEIEQAVKDGKKNTELAELSSKFYTLVPHSFGRSVPPVLNSEDVVNQKKEVMMILSDIELTQSLQTKTKADKNQIHPIDEKYQQLGCKLEWLDKKSDEHKMISKFATACKNSRKCTLLDAWRVDRNGEDKRFRAHNDLKERKLLWHGTNVAVVAAILNSGLRIMPHSGGRVGRGIYFASEHAKSSCYVCMHYGTFEKEKNVGFMLLTEVALGNIKNITHGDGCLKAAPKGYNSIVARGMTEPDAKQDIKWDFDSKEVIVPLGAPIKQKTYSGSSFCQSEYLIYKESQARIRYMLKFSFD